jgi:hypothetical protein
MKLKKIFVLCFLSVLFVSSVVLRAEDDKADAQKADAQKPDDQDKAAIKTAANIVDNYEQWKGLGFGLAYGISKPFGSIIEDYEIVNGILRITNERTALQSVLLESHYFFPLQRPHEKGYKETLRRLNTDMQKADFAPDKTKKYFEALETYEEIKGQRHIGIGPFVCLIPGVDKFLKAFGFGAMIGFRRGKTSNSFNIGIGYINYSDMPALVDKKMEDHEFPKDYNNPIKTKNIGGITILFSFSF